MKKAFLLTIISLFLVNVIVAQKITEQEALVKAQKFMKGKSLSAEGTSLKRVMTRRGSEVGKNPFYIFNVEDNGGFVIVSGDERTDEILAYSDKGHIDIDDIPDNLRYWLEDYKCQINSLDINEKSQIAKRSSYDAVEPLLKSKWNQYQPYNWMCPIKYGQYCLTGCVPTAMAQLMYYYKWPIDKTNSLPEYDDLPSLPETTFKWDKMKNCYNANEEYSNEEGEAVAELMRYCGQSVKTRYGLTVTNTLLMASSDDGTVGEAMKEYFGYSPNYYSIFRKDYPSWTWEELIYREISNGHPVVYSGGSTNKRGSHSFLLDGYDGNGLFHINWGWGGSCDGYFSLSILDPAYPNQNDGNPSDGWSASQYATIGIVPRKDGEGKERTIYYMNQRRNLFFEGEAMGASCERENNGSDFSVYIHSRFCNMDYVSFQGEFGVALLHGGFSNSNIIKFLYSEHIALEVHELFDKKDTYYFGSDLEDGDYILTALYRPDGDSEWHIPSDDYRIITIKDKSLIIDSYDSTRNPSSLELYNIKVEGNYVVGDTINFVMNFTNIGYRTGEYVYLQENGVEIGYIYVNSDLGEQVQAVLPYIPKSSGRKKIEIVSSKIGIIGGGESHEYQKTHYQNDMFIKLKEVDAARKSLEKTFVFIEELKNEMSTGKKYEDKTRNDLEIVFDEFSYLSNLTATYEEKEDYNLSNEDVQSLQHIQNIAENFETYIKDYEYEVTLTINEGGSVQLGESVLRNVESKKIYWLYPKAFTNFEYLSGKWYDHANYGGIMGDMQFMPDEGFRVESINLNGNIVDKVTTAVGEVVITFAPSINGVNNVTNYRATFDVFNLHGQKLKKNISSLDMLPNGIYVVNGKKVVVN